MTRALFPLMLLGFTSTAYAGEIPMTDDEDGEPSAEEQGIPGLPRGDDGVVAQIVNGNLVDETEYREVVHLGIQAPSGGGSCTGSVVDPYWILTAAHCFPTDATGVTITVGNQASDNVKYTAAEWIVHQGWSSREEADGTFDNDIAVIRLDEPIDDVFVMALNDQPITEDWIDTQVVFIGFGITKTNGGDGGTKRWADVPITGFERDRIFAFDGNQSTCQGDSGGPGVVYSGDGYVQVSITSYGAVPCASGPTGHQRVDYNMGWLRARGVPFGTKAGSPPGFACSRELDPDSDQTVAVGVVPFDLKCQVEYHSPQDLLDVVWQWGDGSESSGMNVEHTYETSGNFNLRMCAIGERESGEWQHCVNRNGYVRSCDVPDVAFTVEQIDGFTWKLVNQTDVSTYGCITNVQWDIFDEGGTLVDSVESWEPEFVFPGKGDYRIVLNVGGLGGTGAAELDVDVRRGSPANCNSVGSSTGLGAFGLLAGLLALGRRRRQG